MRDYDSNDEAGAAYLARDDYEPDGPTRAEAERDERADQDDRDPVDYQDCTMCGGLHPVDYDCADDAQLVARAD